MNYTNLSAYISYKLQSPLKISVAVSDLNVVASDSGNFFFELELHCVFVLEVFVYNFNMLM